MKSLDDLIRFLLEDIALCGDHGAGTSDIIKSVETYYSTSASAGDGQTSSGGSAIPVDRKLLGKTWQWLARHPEIQVGEDGKFNKLSLSEVEQLNASRSTTQRGALENAPSTPPQVQPSTVAESPAKRAVPEPVAAIPEKEAIPCPPTVEVRVYVSTERRWQALTGHAFSPNKIPRMDFTCLSIIAAHREQGILQPDLIRISGQDKRSVPHRTQRLQDGGYISKIPVLVNRAHTSKLVHKRYTNETNDVGTIIRPAQNSKDNPTDVLALNRAIFKLLRERKLITYVELKEKIGVSGLKWPMRVLATHLRRLERIGCVKQVRAHPDIGTPSPFLFRCVRHIRDPEGREWNPVIYPGKSSRMQPTSIASNEFDAPSDDEQDYIAEEAQYMSRFGNSQPPESLKEAERPIPQWSGDSTLSNLLYDIVHAAGCQGELKNRSMGCSIDRPVEYHISKLVEMWQISQPLHLRHLSIIRDTALTNSIPHYVHYSYENFKKLVDHGTASWETVITITKEHEQFKNTAAISAQPDLDENGFSKVSNDLFQGPHNDASLADCIRAGDIKLPRLTVSDSVAVQVREGDWILRRGVTRKRPEPRPTTQGEQLSNLRIKQLRQADDPPNLVVSYADGRGRGRKIPAEGFPPGFNKWSTAQKSKLLKSQLAAKLYKMQKIVDEIKRRVKGGTDLYEATASVFVLAMEQYRDADLEPPWELINKVKSDILAPSLLALAGFDQTCSPSTTLKNGRNKPVVVNLKPSSAAHSRPLRDIERRLVERSLRSRIKTIQDVPIEDSKAIAGLPNLLNKQQQEQSNKKFSIARSKAKSVSVVSRAKVKPVQQEKSIMTPQRPSMQLERIAKHYLPSILAHTRPLLLPKTTNEDAHLLKRKSAPDEDVLGRKPKRHRVKKVPFAHDASAVPSSRTSPSQGLPLQSYEQQSQNIPKPTPGLYIGQEAWLLIPGRRGRGHKCLLAVIKSSRIRDLTFLPTQNPTAPQSLAPQDGIRIETSDQNVDGVHSAHPAPLAQTRPTQSYEEQLENISRPTTGFYLGQEVYLRRIGKRGRPCKSRIGLFKSPLLRSLACFSIDGCSREKALPLNQPRVNTQAQNRKNPNSGSQPTQSQGVPSALSPAPQLLDAPNITPDSDLPSSAIRYGTAHSSSCAPDLDMDMGSTVKRNTHSGAAGNSVSPQPSLTTPTKNMAVSGEMCGSNGICSTVAHDGETPWIAHTHKRPSLIFEGGIIEPFEVPEYISPEFLRSETLNTSQFPQIPSKDNAELPGDPSSTIVSSSQRHPAIALDDQNQSPSIRSTSSNHLPQPHISASEASMVQSNARIAQAIQNQGRHEEDPIPIFARPSQPTSTRPTSPIDRPPREPSATLAEDLSFKDIADRSSKPRVRNGVKKVTLRDGSIAVQRRKIVLDIVENCGGIYPGIPELCLPFKEEWNKAGHPGRPETPTLRAAVKALCDNGKLRQLTFNFKDPRGVVIKKDMITKVEISPIDPGVIETQKNVIAAYPNQYIPKETGLSDQARDVFWNPKGHAKMRTMKDLEVDESPVQLRKVPGYVENYEIKAKSRRNRKAEGERRMADLREMMAAGRLPQKVGRSARRKVDRLESLNQKHARKRDGGPSFPSVDEQAEADLHPTHMSLARVTAPGRQSQTQFKALFREQTQKRLAELQQGREHVQGNHSDFNRMPAIENSEQDLASQLPVGNMRQMKFDSVSAAIEGPSPIPRRRGRLPKARGGQELINRQSKAARSYQMPNPNNTSELLTFHLSRNELRPRRNSFDSDWHSPEARQQMYTIMEPEHYFHPATGTFAVNFSRWRTVNQICKRYHWQGPRAKEFADYVDDLMMYELTANGSEHAKYSNWPFINYTFPHIHETSPEQDPSTQVSWFSKRSKGYERVAIERSQRDTPADSTASRPPRGLGGAPKRKGSMDEGLGPFKKRRLTTVARLSQLTKSRAAGDTLGKPEPTGGFQRRMEKRRDRGLTADEMRRILIAVIVIRTLTGGIERHIDWVLVTTIFEPEHDQAYIQRKWPRILQSHRILAQQLQANFQDLFLRAYKDGLVPPLDYDNLLAYDWAWLVNWTIDHIDTPTSGAPDLPLQRDRLDRMFQMTVGDDTNLNAYYEMDTVASVPKRETQLHKQAWVRSLINPKEEFSDPQTEDLAIVKTWIRANVATKAKTYNSRLARDKLAQFEPQLIDQALKEMLAERILMAQNKGRPMPGRNYDLSEQYLKPLKKKIDAARLLQVPIIKRRIDKALAEEGELIIAELTDDVDMIVMQNMQAHGRISLVAKNPPMQKFGLTDNGSYKVRLMDKRKLHFQVGIRATESYVGGNPLLPLPKPPSFPHMENPKTKIPLWYDINGDLIPELWQLTLTATMSVLVTRPGITARVLEPSLRPSLALWEIQLILDWMIEARAARKMMDDRYAPEEWWWLCLDNEWDVEQEAQGEGDVSEVWEDPMEV
ncbi:MAG: hypothetical protein Q9226_001882 [Calogaya cf. arnoldii]